MISPAGSNWPTPAPLTTATGVTAGAESSDRDADGRDLTRRDAGDRDESERDESERDDETASPQALATGGERGVRPRDDDATHGTLDVRV